MYVPKYTITTEILKNIGWVEAAREVINNAPIVPAWEAKFRDEARLRAVHYGTILEGNDLTLGQAKLIMDRGMDDPNQASEAGVVARERDVQEVINYRKVLDYVESMQEPAGKNEAGLADYTSEVLLAIHKLVVDKSVEVGHAGAFRQVQVVLRNSVTGEVGFRPPASSEVALVASFLEWLNSGKGRQEHPVIRAGIAHYVLAAVHPFVEGNGRAARAFATMVLYLEGYDIRRFFALEEYFDKHAEEYFGSLMEVSNQSAVLSERDLTPWLTVFTRALSSELTKIKDKVRELSVDIKIKHRMGRQVQISERQMKLMEYLHSNGEMSMPEAKKILPMVSDDTILRELKALIEKGVITKRGSTKAAKYALKK